MFFRDLKPKTNVKLKVTLAEAHLPVRMGHRDAAQIFAKPLGAQLMATGRGTVIDCRAQERGVQNIVGVDLYLGLTDASRNGLETVARMLDHLSAPCGSSLRLSDAFSSDPIVFGSNEGLEVSIQNQAAPNADARRELALTCKSAVEDIGVSRGWAQSNGRTRLYFYGESFAEMQHRLASILKGHPRFGTAITRRMV